MFSYKWDEGWREHKSTFYGEWERLGCCKAAYKHTITFPDRIDSSLKYRIPRNEYDFVSYGTPIAHV